MKRMLLVLVIVLFSAGAAHAAGVTADVGLGYATEPESGFGSTVGLVAGASVDFNKFVSAEFKPHSDRIRFRADIGYFKWEDSVGGVDIEYKRIPIFLGGRYIFPIKNKISVFGEGGLEISRDEVEVAVCVPILGCKKDSEEDTNTGISIGGGVIFHITDVFRIALSGRRHEITDPYTTLNAAFGFNF